MDWLTLPRVADQRAGGAHRDDHALGAHLGLWRPHLLDQFAARAGGRSGADAVGHLRAAGQEPRSRRDGRRSPPAGVRAARPSDLAGPADPAGDGRLLQRARHLRRHQRRHRGDRRVARDLTWIAVVLGVVGGLFMLYGSVAAGDRIADGDGVDRLRDGLRLEGQQALRRRRPRGSARRPGHLARARRSAERGRAGATPREAILRAPQSAPHLDDRVFEEGRP